MLGGRAARNRYLEEHALRWAESIFHLSIIEHVCSGSLDLLFLLPVLLVDEVVGGAILLISAADFPLQKSRFRRTGNLNANIR